jgi:hypothetical protein
MAGMARLPHRRSDWPLRHSAKRVGSWWCCAATAANVYYIWRVHLRPNRAPSRVLLSILIHWQLHERSPPRHVNRSRGTSCCTLHVGAIASAWVTLELEVQVEQHKIEDDCGQWPGAGGRDGLGSASQHKEGIGGGESIAYHVQVMTL